MNLQAQMEFQKGFSKQKTLSTSSQQMENRMPIIDTQQLPISKSLAKNLMELKERQKKHAKILQKYQKERKQMQQERKQIQQRLSQRRNKRQMRQEQKQINYKDNNENQKMQILNYKNQTEIQIDNQEHSIDKQANMSKKLYWKTSLYGRSETLSHFQFLTSCRFKDWKKNVDIGGFPSSAHSVQRQQDYQQSDGLLSQEKRQKQNQRSSSRKQFKSCCLPLFSNPLQSRCCPAFANGSQFIDYQNQFLKAQGNMHSSHQQGVQYLGHFGSLEYQSMLQENRVDHEDKKGKKKNQKHK